MKIVLIHKWTQEYLKYTVKQLLKYHKKNDIILLTDNLDKTKVFLKNIIEIESIENYFDFSKNFEQIYKHMSHIAYEFEIFCIQRWFILLEYIKKNSIENICHIDSDVMVFSNLIEYFKKNLSWSEFNYVGSCWHVFFWNIIWLEKFKNFVFDIYKKKENIKELERYYKWEKYAVIYRNNWNFYEDKSNSITDMTLFYLFLKKTKNLISNDIWIIKNKEVFDNNLWFSEWFKEKFWLKKIVFENKSIYWFLNNDKIKFNALHFQWSTKKFIIDYYNERNNWLKYFIKILPQFLKYNFVKYISIFLKKIWLYEKIRKAYLEKIIWKK